LTIVIVTHDLQLAKQVERVVAIRDGRTSSEMIRRAEADAEEGARIERGEDETHIEYAVMDKFGRIQVPDHYLEAVGAKDADKVLLQLEEDRIVLRPTNADKNDQNKAKTATTRQHF